jgi:hypothetical protein
VEGWLDTETALATTSFCCGFLGGREGEAAAGGLVGLVLVVEEK